MKKESIMKQAIRNFLVFAVLELGFALSSLVENNEIGTFLLVVMCISAYMIKHSQKKRKEPWDEMTRERYTKVQDVIAELAFIVVLLVKTIYDALEFIDKYIVQCIRININFSFNQVIAIFCFYLILLQLMQLLIFGLIERRDMIEDRE